MNNCRDMLGAVAMGECLHYHAFIPVHVYFAICIIRSFCSRGVPRHPGMTCTHVGGSVCTMSAWQHFVLPLLRGSSVIRTKVIKIEKIPCCHTLRIQ